MSSETSPESVAQVADQPAITPQTGIRRETWGTIATKLAEPFKPAQIHHKPGAYSRRKGSDGKYPQGTRVMMMPFVDARDVGERLDEVVTGARWQDQYVIVDPTNNVVQCALGILIAGEWVWKVDVGYPNDPSTDDPTKEPLKAAYSDALKRAAVKWGIGRHLYRMTPEWVDVDADGKVIRQTSRRSDEDDRGR